MAAVKKRKCCSTGVVLSVILVIGVIFACLGGACIPLFNKLYKDAVEKKLVMKKGEETYNDWVTLPVPVYMKYYVFDYTNVKDIINGSKPVVVQRGPYTYREERLNYVLEGNSDDITYMQNYTYIFDKNSSCPTCTEHDIILIPNIAAWTILHLIGSLHVTENSSVAEVIAVKIFNILLANQDVRIFHNLTVNELLWGYRDKFLTFLKAHEEELKSLLKPLGLKAPPINPIVALQHNGSLEGSYIGNITLKTGNDNIDDLQRIYKWRGLTYSPYWNTTYGPYGEMINGTDGTHFKPYLERSDKKLYIFITDICRIIHNGVSSLIPYFLESMLCSSLYLSYESDQEIQDIKLYRYILTADVFADANTNPDNKPFCVGKCWTTGLLPVSQCLEGAPPVFMSQPHFYQANHTLLEAIQGLEPNKTLHQAFVDVDPITGLTMQVHKRLQINVRAEKIKFIDITEGLGSNEIFLPIMYLDEFSEIDQKNIDKYKHDVVRPKTILKYVRYGLWAFGGTMVVGAIIAYVVIKFKKPKNYLKLSS